MAVGAVCFWLLSEYFASAVETIPLNEAVAAFNRASQDDPVGRFQPPLTEVEVVAAINRQLPALSQEVRTVYTEIARSKRLPVTAYLNSMSGYTTAMGITRPVWWVNLEIALGSGTGYGLRVRENNSPQFTSSDSRLPGGAVSGDE